MKGWVSFRLPRGVSFALPVTEIDFNRDLAIAKPVFGRSALPPKVFSGLDVAPEKPQRGDSVTIAGNPTGTIKGREPLVLQAAITGAYQDHGVAHCAVDKEIKPGMSGGGGINDEGRLVGIVRRGSFDKTHKNEFVDIAELRTIVNSRTVNGAIQKNLIQS